MSHSFIPFNVKITDVQVMGKELDELELLLKESDGFEQQMLLTGAEHRPLDEAEQVVRHWADAYGRAVRQLKRLAPQLIAAAKQAALIQSEHEARVRAEEASELVAPSAPQGAVYRLKLQLDNAEAERDAANEKLRIVSGYVLTKCEIYESSQERQQEWLWIKAFLGEGGGE